MIYYRIRFQDKKKISLRLCNLHFCMIVNDKTFVLILHGSKWMNFDMNYFVSMTTIYLSDRVTGSDKFQQAFHHPASLCLTRMDSGSDYYKLFLVLFFFCDTWNKILILQLDTKIIKHSNCPLSFFHYCQMVFKSF